jgi:steroid delta-isomerase-like uncharacterized protein
MHDRGGATEEFIAAYNDRDWDRLRAVLAPGCIYEQIGRPKRRVEGAEAVVSVFQAWAAALPEGGGTVVTRTVASDSAVALEGEWVGALRGPFGDFSPTGRRPKVGVALFFYLGDGLIRELRTYYDSLAVYQVLGVG